MELKNRSFQYEKYPFRTITCRPYAPLGSQKRQVSAERKYTKRIFNSDKICLSYSDLNFGVTFLEHSVVSTCNLRSVIIDMFFG